jgi:hypothetical protein
MMEVTYFVCGSAGLVVAGASADGLIAAPDVDPGAWDAIVELLDDTVVEAGELLEDMAGELAALFEDTADETEALLERTTEELVPRDTVVLETPSVVESLPVAFFHTNSPDVTLYMPLLCSAGMVKLVPSIPGPL